MKKIVSLLSVAVMVMALSLFTACGGGDKKDGSHDGEHKESAASESGSVVGKWQVVDVAMEGLSAEEEAAMSMMKGMIVGENMMFEFSADGVAKTTSKSMPESSGKYEQSGNTLKVIDAKSGKNESMDIVKMTKDSLFVKSMVDGKGMVMKMKKI